MVVLRQMVGLGPSVLLEAGASLSRGGTLAGFPFFPLTALCTRSLPTIPSGELVHSLRTHMRTGAWGGHGGMGVVGIGPRQLGAQVGVSMSW